MAASNLFRPGDIVWVERPPGLCSNGPWVVTEGILGGIRVHIAGARTYLLRPFNHEHPDRGVGDTTDCVRMSTLNKLRVLSPLEMLALSS